jgi:hypothetical protein
MPNASNKPLDGHTPMKLLPIINRPVEPPTCPELRIEDAPRPH